MLEQVLPEAEVRALETVEVYIATIEPKQTNQVIKFIRTSLPATQGLDHIKQIRKITTDDGVVKLDIVLCQESGLSTQDLDHQLKQAGLASIVTPRIHGVPKHPPLTRSQFELWKSAWPTTFREDINRHPEISDKDEAAIIEHIESAWKHSAEATFKGELPVVAMIVDPLTQTVLATAYDTRTSTGHILQHAVMNCVAAVAKGERDNCESHSAEHRHPYFRDLGDNSTNSTSPEAGTETGAEPVSLSMCGEKRKMKTLGETALSTLAASPLSLEEGVGGHEVKRVKKAYLCTGYDVFLTHEPCVMCSMALVHSRVGRVFYTVPMVSSGGLGSQHKIHSHPNLNHHFFVYRRVGYQAQRDKIRDEPINASEREKGSEYAGLLVLEGQSIDC